MMSVVLQHTAISGFRYLQRILQLLLGHSISAGCEDHDNLPIFEKLQLNAER